MSVGQAYSHTLTPSEQQALQALIAARALSQQQ